MLIALKLPDSRLVSSENDVEDIPPDPLLHTMLPPPTTSNGDAMVKVYQPQQAVEGIRPLSQGTAGIRPTVVWLRRPRFQKICTSTRIIRT